MLNQVILVGRIYEMNADNYIWVSIPRSYKNENGEYDNDIVMITIEGTIKDSVHEFCKKGTVVGIKGRIRVDEDGMNIVAEKMTFLSSPSRDEDDSEEDIED